MSEFNDLKAGDEVVLVSCGLGRDKYHLKKIDRATKTQIVIGNTKFRRSDGREMTDGWYRDRIKLLTEDALKEVEEYNQSVLKWNLMNDLQETDWNKFNLEQLREIEGFINERQTAVKGGE